jgi:hypothetical protein
MYSRRMPSARRIAATAIDLDGLFTTPAVVLPRKRVPAPKETAAIEWGDVTAADAIASFLAKYGAWAKPEDLEKELAAFRSRVALEPTTCVNFVCIVPDDLLLEILAMPPESFIFWQVAEVDYVLARLGERAVAPLRALHAAGKVAPEAILRIRAPFVARIAAAHLSRVYEACVSYHQWLASHADLATHALLHAVLTESDEAVRLEACAGLRFLAALDGARTLREVARGYDAEDAVDPILLPPLAAPRPAKIPKTWGTIAAPLAGKHLEKLLAFFVSEPAPTHPYTQRVLGALDAESLRAFVTAMVRAWTANGSASSHLWLVHADALVLGDAGLRRAGRWARTKSTSSNRNERNNASRALEVLEAFPGEVALAQLADVAALTKADWLRTRADRALRIRLLTTREDLDDVIERATPDLGFAEGVVLDYGSRKFKAKARADLSLFLVDESGATLDELPRPRKSDDAKLAKAAAESWRELRAEVSGVATVARGRLETAMRTGRSWTRERFRAHVLGHPLMRVYAQGLVWAVRRAGKLATFRVAEDASLADVSDRAFELPDAPIVLVHPCELAKSERESWMARFAEYEIVPPIEQLGRVAFDVTPAKSVSTCSGWSISAGAIFGLLRDGWKPIREDGIAIGVERSLGSDRKASVLFSPGFVLSEAAGADLQQLGELGLSEAFRAHERARIDLSEVLRELAGHRNPSSRT